MAEKSIHIRTNAPVDENGTFKDPDGVTRTEYFELTEEEGAELERLIDAIVSFCREKCIPFVLFGARGNQADHFKGFYSQLIPGVRCPSEIRMVATIADKTLNK